MYDMAHLTPRLVREQLIAVGERRDSFSAGIMPRHDRRRHEPV